MATENLPYRPCVGVMLLDRQGRIFAGQRIDSAANAWQMPQGGIDPGETPRDAALRELTEETGVPAAEVSVLRESASWHDYDLPVDLAPKLWGGRFRGQTQKWFAMRYQGDGTSITIETAEPEFRAWMWMEPEVLIERIVQFKRETYSAIFSEFRDLLDAS
ncbi:MAG: RNA pyrophosphohydrolase [Pseudomonadota bacterium]